MLKYELEKQLAICLTELLEKHKDDLTALTLAKTLLNSGLVSNARARQYCAVRAFYAGYANRKKCQLIEEISGTYDVSARLLKSLTSSERRFFF